MPHYQGRELFIGLTKDEKAAAVLTHLSHDQEIGLSELVSRTGLTRSQIHDGIRHLREAKPDCVVTYHRGADSTYQLASDAPEVRDYAIRRMNHWKSQMVVINKEMRTACDLLDQGDIPLVLKAAKILQNLIEIIEFDEQERREMDKRERDLDRREAKFAARANPKTKRLAGVS